MYHTGVAGDKDRKGELFGITNLLNFKDDPFMNYGSDATARDKRRFGQQAGHSTDDLLAAVKDMSEEDFEAVGDDGTAFADLAGRKATKRTFLEVVSFSREYSGY